MVSPVRVLRGGGGSGPYLFVDAPAEEGRRIVGTIDAIDLMTSIDGLTFEDAWRSRVEGTCGGVPVFFIGKDALMKNKAASGRAQDLADLELLRRF